MFRQVLVAAAMAAALSSGAAVAKDSDQATTSASTPEASAKTRYCVKSEVVTGTILQRATCKTLEQWKALGVDPTKQRR